MRMFRTGGTRPTEVGALPPHPRGISNQKEAGERR